ncbi:MAG TPA: hypothetical protein VLC09_00230 [Polyangiaceae bacterium]|nr:hypothetical protein [Polyangiaceae bacterium]
MSLASRLVSGEATSFIRRIGARRGVRWWALAPALATVGCLPLTKEEAQASLEEAQLFSQAATLTGNAIELSSNFTIGGAVEDVVENLRAFYESQMPCAELTAAGSSLTIDFGVKSGNCTFRGMQFTGTHEVTITLKAANEVLVRHEWTELSNGIMVVDGSAQVTWTAGEEASRHLVYDQHWRRISDGREASGSGEQMQRPLGGDLEVGFTVEGDADWEGESGLWTLDINDVEMRWIDPVPQAGNYVLGTPFDKAVTFEFERTAPTKVLARATSGSRDYEVEVTTPE